MWRPLSFISSIYGRPRLMNKEQTQQLAELRKKLHELRGYL
jgi:hypothetical protein